MPILKVLHRYRSLLITICLLYILHASGFLSAISGRTHQFLMHSGFLNAKPIEDNHQAFPFNFSLIDIESQRMAMNSFKGKVIFINVWASWCGPCKAEMPSIEKLYASLDKNDIAFIMLSIDKKGNEDKINKYLRANDFTFPVFRPVYEGDSSFPDILKVPSIPTTFVIDKSGELVFKKIGIANYYTKKFRSFMRNLVQKNQ